MSCDSADVREETTSQQNDSPSTETVLGLKRPPWRGHSTAAASVLRRGDSLAENTIPTLVFDPDSAIVFYWMGLVSTTVLYNACMIGLRIAFPEAGEEAILLYIGYLNTLCDIIYYIDILVQLRTGYLQDGIPVYDPKKIRQQYAHQSYFVMDLVSVAPYENIMSCLPDSIGISECFFSMNAARLPRLLKCHILGRFYDLAECRTSVPHVIRVLRLSLCLAIVIHWIACSYYLLSEYEGLGSNDWVYTNDPKQQIFSRKYIVCMYWSAMTLTTIGNTNSPETDLEYIFTGIIFLTGVFVFATVLGNVGDVISSMNANRQEFQARMDRIKMYLSHKKVPASLQLKIKKWAEYSWSRTKATDESRLLNILPERLRAEVAVHVHLDSLRKVKIFEKCENGFLCELVLKLRPQVFSPGDYICKAGETGREMYIINHGRVEVVVPNASTGEDMVIAVLCEGDYFGEISLLRVDGIQNRRTADVRSVGYSELLCLSRRELMTALVEYPEAKAALEAQAKMRMKTSLQAQRAYSVDALLRSSQSSTEGAHNNKTSGSNKDDNKGREITEIKAMIEELKIANKVPGRTVWQLIARCEVLQSKLQEKNSQIHSANRRIEELETLVAVLRAQIPPRNQRQTITKQFSVDEGRDLDIAESSNIFNNDQEAVAKGRCECSSAYEQDNESSVNIVNGVHHIGHHQTSETNSGFNCVSSNVRGKKPMTFLDAKNNWKCKRKCLKSSENNAMRSKRSVLRKSSTVLENINAPLLVSTNNPATMPLPSHQHQDSTEKFSMTVKKRIADNIKNYLLINSRSLDVPEIQLENELVESFDNPNDITPEERCRDELMETVNGKLGFKRSRRRKDEEEEYADDSSDCRCDDGDREQSSLSGESDSRRSNSSDCEEHS